MKRPIPSNFGTFGDVVRGLQVLGEGRLPVSSYASLPTTAPDGTVVVVLDALKDGETTGNGTGTLAYKIGDTWYRVCDDTAVAT